MKLFYSPTSPYVRKVMVSAIELGLDSRLDTQRATARPVGRDASVVAHNPIGKVPTLVTDSGLALFDSRVICEYLDGLAGGGRLFPNSEVRWVALRDQAMADGLLDAALLIRYEYSMRPEPLRWEDWALGQREKIESSIDVIESGFADGSIDKQRIDIGTITIGCALGYLDLRFPDLPWRQRCPTAAAWYETFSARPSMVRTVPPANKN